MIKLCVGHMEGYYVACCRFEVQVFMLALDWVSSPRWVSELA